MATAIPAFRGDTSGVIFESILNRVPAPASRLNPDIPPKLEEIIHKALDKDPKLRYQTSSAIGTDLRRVRRTLAVDAVTKNPPILTVGLKTHNHYLRVSVFSIAGAVILVLAVWWLMHRRNSSSAGIRARTVAVIPFQNLESDKNTDFLRLAIPDEIATELSYSGSLSIRPFAMSSKYTDTGLDFQKVGKQMRVANIVTGNFLRQGTQLQITLETIDVNSNRTLWRDTFNSTSQSFITMREQLGKRVRQKLLRVLGGSGELVATTRPKNEEAYDLLLRSVAVPYDPVPNKEAIPMLERAVGLDPSYAPTWDALGKRYYFDSAYSDGGDAAFQRSTAAFERAMNLDPNLTSAAGNLIQNLVERGELSKTVDAERVLKMHPDKANARFTLAYFYRYAGLLEESARECDAALALDPGDATFRSCTFTFFELGRTDKARQYLGLDSGSEWAAGVLPDILVREGKIADARIAAQYVSRNPPWYGALLQTCLERPSDMQAVTRQNWAALNDLRDPEVRYSHAATLAFCGQKEMALKLLRTAIAQNYCAVSALDADPLWANVRNTTEFLKIRAEATECQERFFSKTP